nr:MULTISPECIES: bifunctional riboflavin kinase/FAD synthetase [unclassified Leptolyngbya]
MGNFDGIHRGHQRVIEPILSASPSLVTSGAEGEASIPASPEVGVPTVVTFHPHPQEFFTNQRRSLLTPLSEKAASLQQMGIRQLVRLPFNEALAQMTPPEFVEAILVQRLRAQRVSIGQDFCFGRNRSGTAVDLKAIAASFGIDVTVVDLHRDGDERISSSAIRAALLGGAPERAAQLLGRPYQLWGEVVHGDALGRQLGFPTANLDVPAEKFIPRLGVYAVRVAVASANDPVPPAVLPGVMNLGMRPTVNGQTQRVEVHLLDWQGDLYGQVLHVRLESFLRPEQKFSSLDELMAQIQRDCEAARSHLSLSSIL